MISLILPVPGAHHFGFLARKAGLPSPALLCTSATVSASDAEPQEYREREPAHSACSHRTTEYAEGGSPLFRFSAPGGSSHRHSHHRIVWGLGHGGGAEKRGRKISDSHILSVSWVFFPAFWAGTEGFSWSTFRLHNSTHSHTGRKILQ